MPHEIESIAFAGATPWHGLGTALEEADLYPESRTQRLKKEPQIVSKVQLT
jgi:hypothetical protein